MTQYHFRQLRSRASRGPQRHSSTRHSPVSTPAVPDRCRHQPSLDISDEDIFSRGILGEEERERLLNKYRSRKMALFPFVVIPQEETAATLRHHSPFLLLTVLSACQEDNPCLDRQLDAEVRNVVARRIVAQGERNMDLLLGLLVHIAWHHTTT